MNNQEIKVLANNIRKNIITMIYKAQSGHPGGSLSIVDILTVIYDHSNITKDNLDSNNRDKFVLSKGHCAPALYGLFKELDYISNDQLNTFRLIDSDLQGHPSKKNLKGIDMTTGSLGQGLSAAVGMALYNKLYNFDNNIYTIIGDGESQEGQIWEALMCASHYKLDNLCIILDYNGLQIDGKIIEVLNPEPFKDKFLAFNLNVIEIDGHNINDIKQALISANNYHDKPTIIIAKTIKGKGVSFMEDNPIWHGKAPNDDEYNLAIKELEINYG